jgi:hypothetical protein
MNRTLTKKYGLNQCETVAIQSWVWSVCVNLAFRSSDKILTRNRDQSSALGTGSSDICCLPRYVNTVYYQS